MTVIALSAQQPRKGEMFRAAGGTLPDGRAAGNGAQRHDRLRAGAMADGIPPRPGLIDLGPACRQRAVTLDNRQVFRGVAKELKPGKHKQYSTFERASDQPPHGQQRAQRGFDHSFVSERGVWAGRGVFEHATTIILNAFDTAHHSGKIRGKELRNSESSGIRTRQFCGFFTPVPSSMAGRGRKHNTRKGNTVRLTAFRFLTFPASLPVRVETLQQGLSRLKQEHIMTSHDLVPVFTGTLQDQSTQLCNARDLHAFLAVGDRFDQWIRRRIEEYGFTDGEDFCTNLCKTGGRPSTDYHLTLDMAKELAMIENNEQGRVVRKYFIACEKKSQQAHLQNSKPNATLPPPAPRKIAKRTDLSFVARDAKGRLANWQVKNQSDDWGTEFARGGAFFAELAQLAQVNEEEAYDALRFALAGADWQGSEGWNKRTEQQGHGWGVEYGFTEALARAVIDGLRHAKTGNDGFTPGVKNKSATCAIAAPKSVKRLAA
jgi:anti-repressor protein